MSRGNGAEPPFSLQAEEATLGGLLLAPESWSAVADVVTAHDFYRPDHRTIFGAIRALALEGKPSDVVTVSEYLGSTGLLEQVGGLAYIGTLARNTMSAANVRAHAEIVVERSRLRRLQALDVEVKRAIREGNSSTQITAALLATLGQLQDSTRKPSDDVQKLNFPSLSDITLVEHPPKHPVVENLLFPGAWLVVGRPKIGKSWLLLQLALAVAERTSFLGFRCATDSAVLCVFSEDDDSRISSRLAALGVANAPMNCTVINRQLLTELAKVHSGQMTFEVFLEQWLSAHPEVRLVVVDTEVTVRQTWQGEREVGEGSRVVLSDYKQTRAYDEIALRHNVAICLVNHAKKRSGEWSDIHELINRSNTALAGASGSIVLADPPDCDPLDPAASKTRVLGIRGRDITDDILLAVHQEAEMPYFTCDGPYADVRQTQAEEEVLAALLELTPDIPDGGYATAQDIGETVDKHRGTVKRTLSRMLSKNRTTWKGYRLTTKRGKNGGYRLDRI